MFIINSYPLAVIFCFITMLCWGSWANTSKYPLTNGLSLFSTGIIPLD